MKLTLGNGLQLASYDLPFLFGERPPPQEIVVSEVLGFSADPGAAIRKRREDYLNFYQQGIDASISGDPSSAEAFFRKSLVLHDRLPECPASRLHLDAIEAYRADSREWPGRIVLDSK